ncbi:MBG-2 domain-containing protein, partial [Gemmiger formicilis]|uniref:MBG domain-containing protein n=1 Tax=Gemmiger formicilis TaxID=745368 RepID=UPI001DA5DE50
GVEAESVPVTKSAWINDTTVPVDTVDTSDDRYVGYKFDSTDPDPIPTAVSDGTVINVYYIIDENQTYNVNYVVAEGNEDFGSVDPAFQNDQVLSTGKITGSTATANVGYAFDGWYKGDTLITREVTLSAADAIKNLNLDTTTGLYADTTFTAHFDLDVKGDEDNNNGPDNIPDKYQIVFTYVSADENTGYVEGAKYETFTDTTYTGLPTDAIPTGRTPVANEGYAFDYWTDSTQENVKEFDSAMGSFKVAYTQDATFTAHFDVDVKGDEDNNNGSDNIPDKYQVVFTYVSADENTGRIDGTKYETFTDTARAGVPANAIPTGRTPVANEGYAFDYWTDSTQENVKDFDSNMGRFKVAYTQDATFTAHFDVDTKTPDDQNPNGQDKPDNTPDKYQVVVTVKDNSAVYDGQTHSGLTADNAENYTVTTLTGEGLPEGYSVVVSGYEAATGINAGTYTGNVEKAAVEVQNAGVKAEGPYQAQVFAGKLTITPRKVTITADDTYKIEGQEDPELTATVTGAVAGEKLNYTVTREEGNSVGDYDMTVLPGENPNYNVTVEGGTFTIFEDKKGATDPEDPTKETGDDIPDVFQTIFQYVASENGSVSGTTYEVYTADNWQANWQTATKPMVHPAADITLNPADGYLFAQFTASNDTTYANVEEVRALETSEDLVFTAHFTIRTDLTYTVRYLENYTGREVAGAKTVEGQTFGTTVTETAPAIGGYSLLSPSTQSIEITTGENVITFYYQ